MLVSLLHTGLSLKAQTRYIDFSIANESNNGCSNDTATVTDLKEYDKGVNFRLYPNPANKHIILEPSNKQTSIQFVSILDVTGRNIINLQNLPNASTYDLNISSLKKGIYFIVIQQGTHSETLRFIVQ